MLVIYGTGADRAGPPFAPPDANAAWVERRFFGEFPSVADYFDSDSFGRLQLTPAPESDTKDGGRVNDGVVVVSLGANFFNENPSQEQQIRAALTLAAGDPGVDLSIFDTLTVGADDKVSAGPDGKLTDDELVVHFIFAGVEPRDCAIARNPTPREELDGKNIDNLLVGLEGTNTTNLMTIIHETGHIVFGMRDLYAFVDSFDIAGATCGPNDDVFFRTSAFQRMHIGWSVPTVVMEDGFYAVERADRAGQSFILYDPDLGVERYHMVENRVPEGGTYDQSAGDAGLVIWRFNDADYDRWFNGDATAQPVALRSPNGGGAWDPSDLNTRGQRTFEEQAAGFPEVAVRAIPAAGDVMRVFFDVRGPGILVDPSTDEGLPMQVDVSAGRKTLVSFTVQNTGEETDTFEVTLTSMPDGWAADTFTTVLRPRESATASLHVTPKANTPDRTVEVVALGRSAGDRTVVSTAPFTLKVAPPQCSDERDNDGDGRIDFPADLGCESETDDLELDSRPQCNGQPATITGRGTIVGTPGDDVIVGSKADDDIGGRGGDDVICGRRGNDTIRGGRGDDRLFGGHGGDRVNGGAGGDRIDVRDGGRDLVNCGRGLDRVRADRQDNISASCELVRRSP